MSLKNYLTRNFTTQKSRLSQILPSINSSNTKRLSEVFQHNVPYKSEQLPPKVDLRSDMTPVKDQSNIGSSVACSLASAYEYLTKQSNGQNTDISRLFIYYNARMKDNKSDAISESGCSITDAIEVLEKYGTCLESIWPYDISHVNTRPTDAAYTQAEYHQINKALKINVNLYEMKSCLAQGFPFAFGLWLYSSFDKAARHGIVTTPSVCEQRRQSSGSHAMLAVGYNDQSRTFIIRNSWGTDWGDRGYCYIPYDFMANSAFCFDVWTIRKVVNYAFGREYWHFDDLIIYLSDKHRSTETIEKDKDEEYSTDSDNPSHWRNYYHHRGNMIDDFWNQYRNHDGNRSSRDDEEDYFDYRYRRDRYDRDSEPFNQRYEGYTNHDIYCNRNYSSSFYDRYDDQSDCYHHLDNDRRKSMF